MNIVERHNLTADGLRARLFETLDKVIDGKANRSEVEEVCLLSNVILDTVRAEIEVNASSSRIAQEEKELEHKNKVQLLNISEKLKDIDGEIINVY